MLFLLAERVRSEDAFDQVGLDSVYDSAENMCPRSGRQRGLARPRCTQQDLTPNST